MNAQMTLLAADQPVVLANSFTDIVTSPFGGVLGFLGFVLVIAALASAIRSERWGTTLKLVWILIIIFIPYLGAIAWFVWGRKKREKKD